MVFHIICFCFFFYVCISLFLFLWFCFYQFYWVLFDCLFVFLIFLLFAFVFVISSRFCLFFLHLSFLFIFFPPLVALCGLLGLVPQSGVKPQLLGLKGQSQDTGTAREFLSSANINWQELSRKSPSPPRLNSTQLSSGSNAGPFTINKLERTQSHPSADRPPKVIPSSETPKYIPGTMGSARQNNTIQLDPLEHR